jgi:hypothetical protein
MKTTMLIALAGLALAGASAHAGTASAILAGTGPKAVVPGTTGLNPGELFLATGSFMDRVYRSSNGNHWILTARTNTGNTATDEIVITGSGTTGVVRAREGGVADGARTIDSGSIDEKAAINDSGDFVFAANLSPSTATDDEVIIKGTSGGALSVAVREGTSAGPAGTTNGPTIGSSNIDNSGRVSYRNFKTTTDIELLRSNNATLDAKYNAAVPGFPGRLWDQFDTEGYHVDSSGNNFITFASMNGSSTDDGHILHNGVVRMQESVTSVGGGTALTFNEWYMNPNGSWWVQGSNSTTTGSGDWVVLGASDGTYNTLAKTDDPIMTLSTEKWSDDVGFTTTFFAFASDNAGNYVIGGTTDAANTSANAVLVYKGVFGEFELIREGDQVDLNANGILDDDAYITTFNNFDHFLTDSGQFVFEANLRNALGGDIGQALLTMQVPAPAGAAIFGFASLALAKRRRRV